MFYCQLELMRIVYSFRNFEPRRLRNINLKLSIHSDILTELTPEQASALVILSPILASGERVLCQEEEKLFLGI